MKHPGDLSGPPVNVLVVMHCGSETYWMTTYSVMKDSDAMTWQRVMPVVETRTTYRPVP